MSTKRDGFDSDKGRTHYVGDDCHGGHRDDSGLDAILALGEVVREARIKAGLTVDTVEWLTEIYEGRGYSHEDAVKLANGETLPEDSP
jgi:hypothetical protein